MSKKDNTQLLGYDKLIELKKQSEDIEYLKSLSDDELKIFRRKAQNLYLFFNAMQMTTKQLCNSIYGGLGTPALRYFNHAVANDITAEGRDVCKLMEKVGQNYFSKIWPTDYEWHKELKEKFPELMKDVQKINQIVEHIVITADTDSNYVTFDLVFESMGLDPKKVNIKQATEFIVYFMQNRVDPIYADILEKYITGRNGVNHMIFELEAVSGFGIFVAKKKYVYGKLWQDGKYVADKGELKVTGLEIKQNASSKKVKEIIGTFINTIFVKKGNIDANTFFGMCASVKNMVKDMSVDDMAKATKVNNYNKYVINDTDKVELAPKCPLTVRGAAHYNYLIKKNNLIEDYPIMKDGMFVKVYYDETGTPFTYPTDYGCPPGAPNFSLDIQLEKLIFSPVRRLVDGLIEGDLNKMGEDKVQVGFKSLLKNFKK